VNLNLGQLVRCEGLSTSLGIILFITHDKSLDRNRCVVLWNDGGITDGWMYLIPVL